MTEELGVNDPAKRQLLLTFRVMRCAIVAAALLLTTALIVEACRTGALRGSISAYFYSPVRSVFVGCLMAIGVSLIAIQAKTMLEETLLNLAGLLAFVVALVPIRPEICDLGLPARSQTFDPSQPMPAWLSSALKRAATGMCRLDEAAGGPSSGLPDWVVTSIRNNVLSVIIVGAIALVALLVLRAIGSDLVPRAGQAGRRAIAVYLAFLGVGVIVYATFDGNKSTSHYLAAVTMFTMFGAVVAINGWGRPGVSDRFRNQYKLIAVLMFAALPLGVLSSVYWLEAAEIALFTWFWAVQTVQIWDPNRASAQAVLPVPE